jgi:hypothetical protein
MNKWLIKEGHGCSEKRWCPWERLSLVGTYHCHHCLAIWMARLKKVGPLGVIHNKWKRCYCCHAHEAYKNVGLSISL